MTDLSAITTDDRRQDPPRRADDRTFAERCTRFAREAAAILTFASLVIFAAGAVLTVMGVKLSGTPQAIADVKQSQDSLAKRVGRLEARADRNDRSLTFLSYMLCMQKTPHDPIALERCAPIIEAMQAPGAP